MVSLPSVTSPLPPDVRIFLQRVREALSGGDLVTAQQLVDAGVASFNAYGGLTTTATYYATPPAPVGLSATGAMTAVLLEWTGTNYPGHAYTEIWRSSTNNLSTAVLVGQSPGEFYPDPTGSDASNYYWARFVNVSSEYTAGPFNATAGTLGATAPDLAYVMDMLAEEYGTGSEAPFFQLDVPTEIGGVEIPPGTYMKAAFIYEAMIESAMVNELSAAKVTFGQMHGDRIQANTLSAEALVVSTMAAVLAQITTAYVGSAHIEDAAVTNAKIGSVIQSAGYVAGTSGWKIDKTGEMEMNDATFRGTIDVQSATSGARMELTNSTLKVYDSSGVLRVKIGNLA